MSAATAFVAPAAWLGGDRLAGPTAIVARDGAIASIGDPAELPPDARPIELDGTLLPGVVDLHVHISLTDAAAVLRGGVTAVRDLGGDQNAIFALAARSAASGFDGPRVTAAGPLITAPGGYPANAAWAPDGFALELDDPAAAEAVVARLARAGAVAVKLAFAAGRGPALDDATAAALCAAARAHGLPVTAHVEGVGETARALRAGVDELAHVPWTERLDDALVRAVARRVAVVSTLRIHTGDALAIALDNARRLHAHGARIRYGTDLPNDPIAPGVAAGELELLAEAGLSPAQLLGAATGGPPRVGAPANLIAVAGDPLADPSRLAQVARIVKGGEVVA